MSANQKSGTTRRLKAAAFLAVALLGPTVAAAAEARVGDVRISQAWARTTPPGAVTGAAYLTVTNAGRAPEQLLGAASPAAEKVEIHRMSIRDGVMRMQAAKAGVDIPAGQRLELRPGGYHLMLSGLRKPLRPGDRVVVTLRFARAGSVPVELIVRALQGAGSKPQHGAHRWAHANLSSW